MQDDSDPVIIGGSGGSGTRVFAMVCIAAGYKMGMQLNKSYDALYFTKFFKNWINPYLLRQQVPLHSGQIKNMEEQFQECLLRFRAPIKHFGNWGWKNPRSMLMLPFLDSYFPALKFVHVVRDGRDMAYSKNQNQPSKHGIALLSAEHKNLPPQLYSMAFWSKANMLAAKYGEEVMGDRYIRCRFEDICLEPMPSLKRLSDFLKVQIKDTSEVTNRIRTPDSIGRWRTIQAAERVELSSVGQFGLEYFGYLDT